MADLLSVEDVARAMGLVDYTDDRTELARLIDVAKATIEGICNRTLDIAATYTEYHRGGKTHVYVKRPPIVSITSVTDDAQYGARSIAATNYIDGTDDNGDNYAIGKVELWNTESAFTPGKSQVKVVYVGGWTTTTLPADIKDVWIRLVQLWFDNPERDAVARNADGTVWAEGDVPPNMLNRLLRRTVPDDDT